MKTIHPLSFIAGAVTGCLLLLIVNSAIHWMHPVRTNQFMQPDGNRAFQTQDPAAIAERLGMSEEDLQKELSSGKTMPEIMREHGMTQNRRNRSASGSTTTGSGTATQDRSSSSSQAS